MNPDLSKKAINKIETLCKLGCSHVNQLLKEAEKGNELVELYEFSPAEVDMIIVELTQIMSIYDSNNNSCGIDLK
jgi:hypothetical protein